MLYIELIIYTYVYLVGMEYGYNEQIFNVMEVLQSKFDFDN